MTSSLNRLFSLTILAPFAKWVKRAKVLLDILSML